MPAITSGPAQTQSLNAPVGATPTAMWANLPDPSTIPGLVYRVTDYGVAGVGLLVISDGTRWLALGPQVLARSAVSSSVTGTTTETTLATVSVPAGLLGPNGTLRVTALWSQTNNANSKTFACKFGGASLLSVPLTATGSISHQLNLRNRNSQNSQVMFASGTISYQSSGNPVATFAVDTSIAQNFTFTSTLANAADSSALEGYTVEVLP